MIRKIWIIGLYIVASIILAAWIIQLAIGYLFDKEKAFAKFDARMSQVRERHSKVWTIVRVMVESAVVIAFAVQLTIGCISDTEAEAKYDACVSQDEQTEMRLAIKPKDSTGG